ncbi:hypothetical protein CFC21_035728 [Triticum aestivum]|uniref:Uncharacterized protein n=3 Tax=Triticum TaxID=4564 RepID=A0A9R0RM23_TRITD|nr:hypothetical protein CFC21_035728 [Triticum aestivum]VAH62424.1 unnamed protein product [Triticum turgidum subsp. durum]
MVIPFLMEIAFEQPPPDLASFLYKNIIMYLGMCLVSLVTEIMLAVAKFLYLQYEDADKLIYMYIKTPPATKTGASAPPMAMIVATQRSVSPKPTSRLDIVND